MATPAEVLNQFKKKRPNCGAECNGEVIRINNPGTIYRYTIELKGVIRKEFVFKRDGKKSGDPMPRHLTAAHIVEGFLYTFPEV